MWEHHAEHMIENYLVLRLKFVHSCSSGEPLGPLAVLNGKLSANRCLRVRRRVGLKRVAFSPTLFVSILFEISRLSQNDWAENEKLAQFFF